MKMFAAAVITSCIYACSFHVPIEAQVAPGPGVIDVHMHAMKPEDCAGTPVSANFGAFRKTYQTSERDPEALMRRTIAEMDRNHISKAVLSGDDEVVAHWVEHYPGRFLPSYNHRCDGNTDTVAKFESEWKAGKWKAIGELGLPYGGRPLNDPACFPLFELPNGMTFRCSFTQVSAGQILRGDSPKFRISLSDPLLLEDVAIRFPKLKIVIMHMGWPYYDHALYMLFTYENVYLDTAAVDWLLGRKLFNRMLEEAVQTVGSDRILFRTDQMVWPQMITSAVHSIRDAPYLSDQDKRMILSENARILLKISR